MKQLKILFYLFLVLSIFENCRNAKSLASTDYRYKAVELYAGNYHPRIFVLANIDSVRVLYSIANQDSARFLKSIRRNGWEKDSVFSDSIVKTKNSSKWKNKATKLPKNFIQFGNFVPLKDLNPKMHDIVFEVYGQYEAEKVILVYVHCYNFGQYNKTNYMIIYNKTGEYIRTACHAYIE